MTRLLGLAAMVASTYATEFTMCSDTADFVDAKEYSCDDWAGFDCCDASYVTLGHYSADQFADVAVNCGYSCGLSCQLCLERDDIDMELEWTMERHLDEEDGGSYGGSYGSYGSYGSSEEESATTDSPTASPTASPTIPATDSPTASPPTASPTIPATDSPTASPPTNSPTASPPTNSPTASPPTNSPTVGETVEDQCLKCQGCENSMCATDGMGPACQECQPCKDAGHPIFAEPDASCAFVSKVVLEITFAEELDDAQKAETCDQTVAEVAGDAISIEYIACTITLQARRARHLLTVSYEISVIVTIPEDVANTDEGAAAVQSSEEAFSTDSIASLTEAIVTNDAIVAINGGVAPSVIVTEVTVSTDTHAPTSAPTAAPTIAPTMYPTAAATPAPTIAPTAVTPAPSAADVDVPGSATKASSAFGLFASIVCVAAML